VDSTAPRRLKVAVFVNLTLNSQVQQKTNLLRVWTTVRFSRGTRPCGVISWPFSLQEVALIQVKSLWKQSLCVCYKTNHTYSVKHNKGFILIQLVTFIYTLHGRNM